MITMKNFEDIGVGVRVTSHRYHFFDVKTWKTRALADHQLFQALCSDDRSLRKFFTMVSKNPTKCVVVGVLGIHLQEQR